MTQNEFLEKYGNVLVTFSSYYKYSFTYKGTLEDGSYIEVRVGGNSDDIYRFEVFADKEKTIDDLYPYSGQVFKDGKEIEEFFEY